MGQGGFGDFHPAQHARHFLHPGGFFQGLDAGAGGVLALQLVHLPVLVALGGHLGLVGDAQHLGVAAQLAQQAADDLGDAAAHAHVHFVEYQAGHGQIARADHLDRQAHPGQFAAGGHLGQRPGRLARVGGEAEFHFLQAVRARLAFLHRRLQTGGFHAQGLELLLHLPGQGAGGVPATPAQGQGLLHVGVAGALLGGGQGFQVLIEVLQGVRFLGQAPVVLHQFLRAQAVLAGQGVGLAEPLLHLVEPFRVEVQFLQIVAQVLGGGFHLQAGGFHRVEHSGQAIVAGAGFLHPVADLAQMIVDGAVLAVVQGGDRLLAQPDQGVRVAQALLLLLQVRQFALGQIQRFQLLELEAQQFLALGLLAGAGQGVVVGAPGGLPGAPVLADGGGQLAGLGQVVEQGAVGILAQQGLVLMLAVDADQVLAQVAHLGERRGRAVDVGSGAAVGAHRAAQQALIAVVQLPFGEPGAGRRVVPQVEGGQHLGPFAAGAHHGAVGALPQGQRQGVDEHRLAGAGLAADHGEARFRFQLQLVHGGEVANTEMGQHGLSFWPVVVGMLGHSRRQCKPLAAEHWTAAAPDTENGRRESGYTELSSLVFEACPSWN